MHVGCRTADTLKLLHETEKKAKEQKEQAYINLDTALDEQQQGNKVRLCNRMQSAGTTIRKCKRPSERAACTP